MTAYFSSKQLLAFGLLQQNNTTRDCYINCDGHLDDLQRNIRNHKIKATLVGKDDILTLPQFWGSVKRGGSRTWKQRWVRWEFDWYIEKKLGATQQTQNICITFVQCWTNVEDFGPTFYKCYTHVLCLLSNSDFFSFPSTRKCWVSTNNIRTLLVPEGERWPEKSCQSHPQPLPPTTLVQFHQYNMYRIINEIFYRFVC